MRYAFILMGPYHRTTITRELTFMSSTGLEVFDRSVPVTNIWLGELMVNGIGRSANRRMER